MLFLLRACKPGLTFILFFLIQGQAFSMRSQVLVLGDSIAAFPGANFGNVLQSACKNTLWRNISKSKLDANQLLKRLDNYLNDKTGKANWRHLPNPKYLIVFGGINSVENPAKTIEALRQIFVTAHSNEFIPIGLTLTPWGDLKDKRWRGANSVLTMAYTKRIVDFVMGRLNPRQALKETRMTWKGLEQPTIKIDLFDSELREKDADLWPTKNLKKSLLNHKTLGPYINSLKAEAQQKKLKKLVDAYRSFPRWFLAKKYRSFDYIHVECKFDVLEVT